MYKKFGVPFGSNEYGDDWKDEDLIVDKLKAVGLPATGIYTDKTRKGLKVKVRLEFNEKPNLEEVEEIAREELPFLEKIIDQGFYLGKNKWIVDLIWYEDYESDPKVPEVRDRHQNQALRRIELGFSDWPRDDPHMDLTYLVSIDAKPEAFD